MTYDEARVLLAEGLEEVAKASPYLPAGRYDEIDAALPREPGPEWRKVFVALSFWDGWIDASCCGWEYYRPLKREDWPPLALQVAQDLRENREISDTRVVDMFDIQPRKPSSRVKTRFGKGAP